MQETREQGGSGAQWGPLFGARDLDWAETWEGPDGWGTPVYQYVLDRAKIGRGSWVLDCGCGAGRFARMAADGGASVAGIDAAEELVAVASGRTPAGDFRVDELEALPWPDDSFDLVTGFSAFQFADDKRRALSEARRVARALVAVVIPTRVSESGVAMVFTPLFRHFPPEALERMKGSGMFALSEPGRVEEVLGAAGLTVEGDNEIECAITFVDPDIAERAFMGAGPMALAIRHSGEPAVQEGVRDALRPFTSHYGRVTLPAWYRVVLARGSAR